MAATTRCCLCDHVLSAGQAYIVGQMFGAPTCTCDLCKLAKAVSRIMADEEPQDTETELMELEANAEAFERGFEAAFGVTPDDFAAAVRHWRGHERHQP